MYQIAIGEMGSFTVIDGLSVAAPYKHAVCHFDQSGKETVTDKIDIFLKGSPTEISTAIITIETVITRSELNAQFLYEKPQYFRFQLQAGGDYAYAQISEAHLTSNVSGYKTHYAGSLILSFHYTRPNYFTADQTEVPLNVPAGEGEVGGVTLYNHTDYHPTHVNSVDISPYYFSSQLPSPLRFELTNTYSSGSIKDVFVGLYHHPTNIYQHPFFHNASDFSGGSMLMNVNAINDYYRHFTWSGPLLKALGAVTLDLDIALLLAGLSYRPLVHLYNHHAYSDLYLSFKLQRGTEVIYTSEPAYADPDYGYVLLPPVELPPNLLLRETFPHSMDFVLYAQKSSGGTSNLYVDQLLLLPLAQAANFLGFTKMYENNILIDDSFRGLHNVQFSLTGSELVAHIRQGGPFYGIPRVHNRLFFIMVNQDNDIDIMRTASLQLFQRKARRIL